ncbi:MAG: ABC transporter ATP-binding protein/permease, partial [Lachnospiraceae bacterium]|nr:ABC transporter ATP-binding protein/permease [Lachnospiraceae bacterium]
MIESLKKAFEFCGKRRSKIFGGLILQFLRGGFGVLQLLGIMILLENMGNTAETRSAVIKLVIITVVCLTGSYITGYLQNIVLLEADFYMVEDKRFQIGNLLKKMPLGIFTDKKSEAINAALTTSMSTIEMSAAVSIVGIIGGFLTTLSILIMLLVYEFRIAIIVAICMILYFLIINLQTSVSRKNAHIQKDPMDKLISATLTYVQGIKVSKIFSYKDGDKKLKSAIEDAEIGCIGLTEKTMPAMYLSRLSLGIFESCIIGVDLYLYMVEESIDLNKAILLLILSFVVFAAINQAGLNLSMVGVLENAIDSVENIEKLETLEIKKPEEEPRGNDIEFENVSFSYGDNEVIKDVSFKLREGSFTAIIGPSGSGKTTLCQLIPRFWEINRGSIRIGGADIRNINDELLNKKISMVFQKVYLFEDTIENNIKLGKPDATYEEVVEAAKSARCHDFISRLPEGYKTVVTESGGNLSGGEKQRISIARAILKDSPIIILDEATSALDMENEHEIISAIEELTKNKTVIMIAHRMKTVRNADEIIAIENGKIVEKGCHEELIKRDGLYSRFIVERQKAK